MRTLVAGLGVCGVLAAATCLPHVRPPQTTRRIELHVTPGKPGAVTERLVAEVGPGSAERRVQRVGGDGKELAAVATPLAAKDFEAVWAAAAGLAVRDLPPTAATATAADFGERRLVLRETGDAGTWTLDVRWTAPLSAANEPFGRAVAAAARLAEGVAGVELFHLPRAAR